ncbi:NlpC/P60 family protein [Streptomyces sp. NPDC017254]|uniref:NlpC/P60 family protein n=1 Tax=unclassified Streptomyces TaxID=2593676 RepID=UPI0037BA5910
MPDTTTRKRRRRGALAAVAAVGLLGTSVHLTGELNKARTPPPPPVVEDRAATPIVHGALTFERLGDPNRTVARGADGAVVATFTDGARTAVLAGPVRTFAEARFTKAKVVTDRWVRLLPRPWTAGAEKAGWFTAWFAAERNGGKPDVLAFAQEYLDGAKVKKDARGTGCAGDAGFGPVNPDPTGDKRLEESDFFDYLGIPYTFRDGTAVRPDKARYRAVDCSGYIRLVLGYRARFPLAPSDDEGDGLPRTSNGMARGKVGVDTLAFTGERPRSLGKLQPGDLVFFEIDARTGARLDHVGMYMGLDTEGKPRFVSSREEADGPTFGDLGGVARLDGDGFYAAGLRSAKRL